MTNKLPKFSDFKLNEAILSAIRKKGYQNPTPIQVQSIPLLLEGNDLLGVAQTGTGKTAAFTLPILHNLKATKRKVRAARMRCLILTPTRELAAQIHSSLKLYGRALNLKHGLMHGGVSNQNQIVDMSKGLETLVATPGRLIDLVEDGHVFFDELEVFVLDEADRMLDMGFFTDVKKIIDMLPTKRQTMLFSATMPDDIIELSKEILTSPKRIEVTPQATTVEKIDQCIYMVDRTNKHLLLKSVLRDKKIKRMLVFSRTRHGADRIVRHLEKEEILCAVIHGDKSQGAREKALSNFKTGQIRVLVATDIAARGIDVVGITHIVNYDMPSEAETYVHRIGRTARAGKDGQAISFCDQSEMRKLRAIEALIKHVIPVDASHEYHGAPAHIISEDGPKPNKQQRAHAKKLLADLKKKQQKKKKLTK